MSDVTLTPGTFCWHELSTRDADGAQAFYGDLFGWGVNTDETPMGPYHKWTHGGGEFGAVFGMDGPMFEGVPSHWMPYVLVTSVDASVAKVKELGGTVVMEPMDVMEHGRMAVLTDPTGAAVSLWENKAHTGASTDPTTTGAPIWTELATRDKDAAFAFYTGLFGWRADEKSGGPMPYTEWWDGENCRGGMIVMDEKMGDAPPHWLTYFSVDDCDATVAKASGHEGASICVPAMDIPGVGRMAVITDPQGATFAVIKMSADHK